MMSFILCTISVVFMISLSNRGKHLEMIFFYLIFFFRYFGLCFELPRISSVEVHCCAEKYSQDNC
jgi:hypothetical protein